MIAARGARAQFSDMVGQISEVSASKRRHGRGRPFVPGRSGNPGGRPKAALDVQQLARAHTTEAVAALVRALGDPRHCVAAAVALLDRGFGKPIAMVAVDPERPIAVEFQWSDAAPAAHTDTPSVRHIGDAIESAIIDAVVDDEV